MTTFDKIKLFPENIKTKIKDYGIEDEETRAILGKDDFDECFEPSEIESLKPFVKKVLCKFFNFDHALIKKQEDEKQKADDDKKKLEDEKKKKEQDDFNKKNE